MTCRHFIQLPVDQSHEAAQKGRYGRIALAFESSPSFNHLVAAFALLLQRYHSGSTVGFVLRRSSADGFMPVELTVDGEASLEQFIAHVHAGLLPAANSLGLAASSSEALSNVAVDGSVNETPWGFQLSLRLEPTPVLLFQEDAFEAETSRRLADNLMRAYDSLVSGTCVLVRDVEVMSDHELNLIQADTTLLVDDDFVLTHELIERICAIHANKIAVADDNQEISYRDLSLRSNQLGRYLSSLGVVHGDSVGVCFGPRVELLIAMIACFKLGAKYLPLDPTHPEQLTSFIIDESTPKVVLFDQLTEARSWRGPDSTTFVRFEDAMAELGRFGSHDLDVNVDLSDECYSLFTSGTTGRPKGVSATHRNLAFYLRAARNEYGFGASDAFCSVARYTFSISLFELLSPLCVGASLRLLHRDEVLQPEKFIEHVARATVLHAGPSLISSLIRLLDKPGWRPFAGVRHASSGGDIVAPTVVEGMKKLFPKAELFVIYGCTEISCMGCTHPIARDTKATRNLVGRPFPGVKVRVVDKDLGVVPLGAVGEILFSGPGLVPHYMNRPELDDEKFIQFQGDRYYRTEDLGRFDSAGNLEILGRRDFQVQVRGMRVELVGIENLVREMGLAEQCAAALRTLDDSDSRLVLFVVDAKSDLQVIRKRLSECLPDYMVPGMVVPIEALPLTANGKLDRRGLDELPLHQGTGESGGQAPRNLQERQVAQAFSQALGRDLVSIDDDFFALGGHSLLAVQVAMELQNALGVTFSPGLLFDAPTVRTLVESLHSSEGTLHRPILLSKSPAPRNLFLIAGVNIYGELAAQLEGEFSVYGVFVASELAIFEEGATVGEVKDLAARYVEVIRRQQGQGPYCIGGLSFGGIVAHEVAATFLRQGEDVRFVGMLDAILPDVGWQSSLRKINRLIRLSRSAKMDALSSRGRKIYERLQGKRRATFSEGAGGQFAEMELFREDSYRNSARKYALQVRDLGIPLTLVVARKRVEKNPMSDRFCGWSRIAPKLNAHWLDSDHLDLLRAPYVSDVASIFLRAAN